MPSAELRGSWPPSRGTWCVELARVSAIYFPTRPVSAWWVWAVRGSDHVVLRAGADCLRISAGESTDTGGCAIVQFTDMSFFDKGSIHNAGSDLVSFEVRLCREAWFAIWGVGGS